MVVEDVRRGGMAQVGSSGDNHSLDIGIYRVYGVAAPSRILRDPLSIEPAQWFRCLTSQPGRKTGVIGWFILSHKCSKNGQKLVVM